jgi:uncharacterized protein (DUF433 family)
MTQSGARNGPVRHPAGGVTPGNGGSWISKNADRCGGDACIRDHRIPVWVLVNYRRLAGASDADILREYQSLTAADLEAAWRYAAENAAEIEQAIRENEAGEAGLVE